MSILKIPVTEEDRVEGGNEAFITLVEYGDYQCPFCSIAYTLVKSLQEHFGEKLRFVFRNFPLTEIHLYSEDAAQFAEFAGDKGKFWQMHGLIFENQERLSRSLLFELAEKLILSRVDLELVLEQKTYESKIQKDFMGGVRSGVNGTPTFFINNDRYNGPVEVKALATAMEVLLP